MKALEDLNMSTLTPGYYPSDLVFSISDDCRSVTMDSELCDIHLWKELPADLSSASKEIGEVMGYGCADGNWADMLMSAYINLFMFHAPEGSIFEIDRFVYLDKNRNTVTRDRNQIVGALRDGKLVIKH